MIAARIIAVGELKNPSYREAVSEYMKRLAPYARVFAEAVAASPFRTEADKQRARQEERRRLRKKIGKNNKSVFLLDEHGTGYDSASFAEFLEQKNPVTFVIAGALGFDDELKEEFPSIALSRLTLPHKLARVVLMEQLYRAATILWGKQYHY